MTGITSAMLSARLVIQHAGPKLRGYATSTTAKTTVAQNTAEGWLREVMDRSPGFRRRDDPHSGPPFNIRNKCIGVPLQPIRHCRWQRVIHAGRKCHQPFWVAQPRGEQEFWPLRKRVQHEYSEKDDRHYAGPKHRPVFLPYFAHAEILLAAARLRNGEAAR